jgi:hypothetical protein
MIDFAQRTEPGDEGYDELRKRLRGGGNTVIFQGIQFLALEDNGKIVFVKERHASDFDHHYGEGSLPS